MYQIDDVPWETRYHVVGVSIPSCYEFPWLDDECDVLVAIVDPTMLSDSVAEELAMELVKLNNDWIEAMGQNSEALHDLIDMASVTIGRQARVGDGFPMTGWHDDMVSMNEMIDWIAMGGHGGNDNKLVVVVAADDVIAEFARRLQDKIAKKEPPEVRD